MQGGICDLNDVNELFSLFPISMAHLVQEIPYFETYSSHKWFKPGLHGSLQTETDPEDLVKLASKSGDGKTAKLNCSKIIQISNHEF